MSPELIEELKRHKALAEENGARDFQIIPAIETVIKALLALQPRSEDEAKRIKRVARALAVEHGWPDPDAEITIGTDPGVGSMANPRERGPAWKRYIPKARRHIAASDADAAGDKGE